MSQCHFLMNNVSTIDILEPSARPGVKLQLQGRMVCRLGMLLLGPSNVKVLGGEVEDLVDRNSQVKLVSVSAATDKNIIPTVLS